MSEPLKPCPFCEPLYSDPVLVTGSPGNSFVMCRGCNCATDDGTAERVVGLWNQRNGQQ
ncbi:Lar family restriction alleviation protein [Hyphomicrobium sp. 99]|uniref:Lar family restriction alleviation protein n=1 Tax=Hyphomicrobium sp. 99 TaxID=1163419 RepID=UPI003528BF5A